MDTTSRLHKAKLVIEKVDALVFISNITIVAVFLGIILGVLTENASTIAPVSGFFGALLGIIIAVIAKLSTK